MPFSILSKEAVYSYCDAPQKKIIKDKKNIQFDKCEQCIMIFSIFDDHRLTYGDHCDAAQIDDNIFLKYFRVLSEFV